MVRQTVKASSFKGQKMPAPSKPANAGIARPEPKATTAIGPPAKPAPPLNKFTGNSD
jgi:hypothetical protein